MLAPRISQMDPEVIASHIHHEPRTKAALRDNAGAGWEGRMQRTQRTKC